MTSTSHLNKIQTFIKKANKVKGRSLRLRFLVVAMGYENASHKLMNLATNLVNEFLRLFASNNLDGADFLVVESDTVEFIRSNKHFRSESRRNELRRRRELVNHRCTFLQISIK